MLSTGEKLDALLAVAEDGIKIGPGYAPDLGCTLYFEAHGGAWALGGTNVDAAVASAYRNAISPDIPHGALTGSGS